MAIAYDNALGVEGVAVTSLTTASWAISGSNRYLIAAVLSGGGVSQPNPTSCKWGGSGGTSMTLVGANTQFAASTGFGKISQFGLIAPSASTTTLYCSWASAPDESALAGVSYTGVDQATPLGTQATATGLTTPATVDASSSSGELVVDSVGAFGLGITAGANQTARYENDDVDGFWSFGMSEEAGGGTITMSWTTSGNEDWGIQAVALKPQLPSAALLGAAPQVQVFQPIIVGFAR